jgi:hypothetical protein
MKCICGKKMKRSKRDPWYRCTASRTGSAHGVPLAQRAADLARVKAVLARMYPTRTPQVGTPAQGITTDEASQ